MNVTSLTKLHSELLENGATCNDYKDELIDILGGIDNILSHYISNQQDNFSLTQQQITQIGKILSENVEDPQPMLRTDLFLKKHDDWIHYFFQSETAAKITKTIWNKWVIGIILVFIVLVFIGSFANTFTPSTFDQPRKIIEIILIIIITIYAILLILAVNRFVFKKITRSFEFGFKTFYAIRLAVSYHLYTWQIQGDQETNFLNVIHLLFVTIAIVLPVIVVSLFDGYNIKISNKMVFGISFSLFYTLQAFIWTFNFVDPGNEASIDITSNGFVKYPVIAMMGSSTRIIAIFFWKQTLWSIRRRDRCINIRVSPYLHWIKNSMSINNSDAIKKDMTNQQIAVEIQTIDHYD